ncbi:hypothetical protein NL676_037207 [Syzygium grande]|nr:hypothetical protein NL676_037207 [Syzygium grande]
MINAPHRRSKSMASASVEDSARGMCGERARMTCVHKGATLDTSLPPSHDSIAKLMKPRRRHATPAQVGKDINQMQNGSPRPVYILDMTRMDNLIMPHISLACVLY